MNIMINGLFGIIVVAAIVSETLVFNMHGSTQKKSGSVYIVYKNMKPVGTAFKIGNHRAVTAAHVCESLDDISYILIENDIEVSGVTQLHIHPDTALDVCVLETRKPLKGYEFKLSSTKVESYERLTAYGFPGAERPILLLDVIVLSREVIHPPFYFGTTTLPTNYLIKTNKQIIPGMSGGPAVGEDGEVKGINARVDRSDNTSYFTPVYRIKEWAYGI